MFAYYLHNFDPFIFRLWGNVGPRWYGMAYVLAFVCGYLLLVRLARRGYLDLKVPQVGDFLTWAALFGVMLGGRLGYILFYKPEMLREPISVLRVWEGGMSSHGGMLGIFFFTLYYASRHHVRWTNLGDAIVVATPIGLFFGRCANFINGELYGRAANVSWAVQFPKELVEASNASLADKAVAACQQLSASLSSPEAILEGLRAQPGIANVLRGILTPRHPSQLYEALGEGVLLFAIMWLVRTRLRTPNGFLTGLFFILYAVVRIFVETFREPDAPLIGMFTRGQFYSFFLILLGLAFLVWSKVRPSFPVQLKTAS